MNCVSRNDALATFKGRKVAVAWASAHARYQGGFPRGLKPTPQPPSHRRRAGFTLLEFCASMLVGSAVFGISVQFLKLTMQSTEGARDRVAATEGFARLAERFCADAHAAREIAVSQQKDKTVRWIMRFSADERAEFQPREGQVLWTKYRGEKVAARDAFLLPQQASVRFELEPKDKPAIASLLVKIGVDHADASAGQLLRIDASIGRDLRFADRDAEMKEGK